MVRLGDALGKGEPRRDAEYGGGLAFHLRRLVRLEDAILCPSSSSTQSSAPSSSSSSFASLMTTTSLPRARWPSAMRAASRPPIQDIYITDSALDIGGLKRLSPTWSSTSPSSGSAGAGAPKLNSGGIGARTPVEACEAIELGPALETALRCR